MEFTRDFTGAPEGALKVNGPIQIAQGNLANGAGEYVPASGELFWYDGGNSTYLVVGDGNKKVSQLPAITDENTLTEAIEDIDFNTPINNIISSYTGIDSGFLEYSTNTTLDELNQNDTYHYEATSLPNIYRVFDKTNGNLNIGSVRVTRINCEIPADEALAYKPLPGEIVFFGNEAEQWFDLVIGLNGNQTLSQLHAEGGILKRLSDLEARCTALETSAGISGGTVQGS